MCYHVLTTHSLAINVITMYKLTYKKRAWLVKQYNKGISASKLALAQRVNRRCIYQIIDKYKQHGFEGLKDHKTGRPETKLSHNAEIIILDLRKRYKYGACHIEQILKKKGFGIPLSKWFNHELKDLLLDYLNEERIKKSGIFHNPYNKQLLDEHFSYTRDNRKQLWTLLVFEMWREHYLK